MVVLVPLAVVSAGLLLVKVVVFGSVVPPVASTLVPALLHRGVKLVTLVVRVDLRKRPRARLRLMLLGPVALLAVAVLGLVVLLSAMREDVAIVAQLVAFVELRLMLLGPVVRCVVLPNAAVTEIVVLLGAALLVPDVPRNDVVLVALLVSLAGLRLMLLGPVVLPNDALLDFAVLLSAVLLAPDVLRDNVVLVTLLVSFVELRLMRLRLTALLGALVLDFVVLLSAALPVLDVLREDVVLGALIVSLVDLWLLLQGSLVLPDTLVLEFVALLSAELLVHEVVRVGRQPGGAAALLLLSVVLLGVQDVPRRAVVLVALVVSVLGLRRGLLVTAVVFNIVVFDSVMLYTVELLGAGALLSAELLVSGVLLQDTVLAPLPVSVAGPPDPRGRAEVWSFRSPGGCTKRAWPVPPPQRVGPGRGIQTGAEQGSGRWRGRDGPSNEGEGEGKKEVGQGSEGSRGQEGAVGVGGELGGAPR